MLQQFRSLRQWRSGLWVTDVPSSGKNYGPSGIQPNHPQHIHQSSDSPCSNGSNHNTLGAITSGQWVRCYSSQGRRPNFLSQFIENIKQDVAKNKEMKENLRKFREEAEKLEQSDALKKARAKYMTLENEASVLKAKLGKVKDTVSGVLEEASKTEIAKKAGKISEELGKSARDAAETISAKGQKLGATEPFKAISEATSAVREELETSTSQSRVYVAPSKLRKRLETPEGDTRTFAPDSTTIDVELHRDSRLYESWQNFKNNNAYFNKILDWKMKYDESENPMIRVSRVFTDRVSNMLGGLFQNTELSSTLTEIVKVDPNFSKTKFLRQCEMDIIPNILEAMTRGDLDILRDWCHEAPFNLLSGPIKQAQQIGAVFDSKVLDIENLDLAMGKIMDPGPVLIITFTSQQILCVRDKDGNVMEGDPEKVLRIHYAWALSRDKNVLDPRAAWRLLDISASSVEQFV